MVSKPYWKNLSVMNHLIGNVSKHRKEESQCLAAASFGNTHHISTTHTHRDSLCLPSPRNIFNKIHYWLKYLDTFAFQWDNHMANILSKSPNKLNVNLMVKK